MPVENSSRKTTGVSTMNILATCTRRRKPPLRSWTFRVGLGRQAEVVHHAIGAARARRAGQAVEARERQQVVAHRQQQLGGVLLDDDDDAAADARAAAPTTS